MSDQLPENLPPFVIESMARVAARLESVDPDDLHALVSLERLGNVVGLSITGPQDVTEKLLAGPLRGFAAAAAYIEQAEEALMSFNLDESLILQDAALVVASEDDVAALFLWGGIIAGGINDLPSATSYINEAGVCPNGTKDCRVNGFSDAIYALAVKAGERHGFNIPDLGVSERRFDDGGVEDYIDNRKAQALIRMMGALFGEAPPAPQNNSFGGGGWGNMPIAEG
jgi:hypothetical protein